MVVSRLHDLQNKAAGMQHSSEAKRVHIRYSDAEWDLLAQAMVAEFLADPENVEKRWFTIANDAQRNQKPILLGDMIGRAEWPTRHFVSTDMLIPVMPKVYQLLTTTVTRANELNELVVEHKQLTEALATLRSEVLRLQEVETLFKSASDENEKLTKELKAVSAKGTSLDAFKEEDIIAEAAFIQAQRADRIEQAAKVLNGAVSQLAQAISENKVTLEARVDAKAAETISVVQALMHSLTDKLSPERRQEAPARTSYHGSNGKPTRSE